MLHGLAFSSTQSAIGFDNGNHTVTETRAEVAIMDYLKYSVEWVPWANVFSLKLTRYSFLHSVALDPRYRNLLAICIVR